MKRISLCATTSRLVLGLNEPPSLGNNVATGLSYTSIYCQIQNVWFDSLPSHITQACSMSQGQNLP